MSQEMNASQIAFIINDCLEGVERSKIGSVFVLDEQGAIKKDMHGNPYVNTLAVSTFMNVLSCYFPKNFKMEGPA